MLFGDFDFAKVIEAPDADARAFDQYLIVGVAFDESIHSTVRAEAPALAEAATGEGGFMWMSHDRIEPERAEAYIAGLPADEAASVRAVYSQAAPQGRAQVDAGRDVLAYAVRFPLLLLVVFGAIALWFRMRGGYRPIELDTGA